MKIPSRALEIEAKTGSALVSRNPEAASSTTFEIVGFYQTKERVNQKIKSVKCERKFIKITIRNIFLQI